MPTSIATDLKSPPIIFIDVERSFIIYKTIITDNLTNLTSGGLNLFWKVQHNILLYIPLKTYYNINFFLMFMYYIGI